LKLFSAVHPAGHNPPIGKYSPGVLVPLGGSSSLLFISGQVASDYKGKVIAPGDVRRQTEMVFARMEAVLEAGGGSLADLVSVVIYVTEMAHFAAVSEVRNRVLGDPAPSSTFVEVSALAVPGHLVEISGIALVSRAAE
jgi:2-iminobutanoate/2-iminopropanoate deaminase